MNSDNYFIIPSVSGGSLKHSRGESRAKTIIATMEILAGGCGEKVAPFWQDSSEGFVALYTRVAGAQGDARCT